jgi:hypothetical protein
MRPKETDIKAVVSYEGPPYLLWFKSLKHWVTILTACINMKKLCRFPAQVVYVIRMILTSGTYLNRINLFHIM